MTRHSFTLFACLFFCVDFTHVDGLNSTTQDNSVMGTNVKQEPLSDDECNSEDGYGYDGNHDEFDEEDAFNQSTINIFSFNKTIDLDYCISNSIYTINLLSGDFEGSDNDYDDDNNEYDNSGSKGFGCQHWERKTLPDLANVKEEKVCRGNRHQKKNRSKISFSFNKMC